MPKKSERRPATAGEARATQRARGFTLLEVMAAVGILALVYVVLAQGAMQGIVWEGDSRRRLEASLLADTALADLEARWLSTGEVPEIGEQEQEQGDYVVIITTSSADAIAMLSRDDAEPSRFRAGLGGSQEIVNPAEALAALMPVSPLRDVLVEVVWIDAFDEHRLSRRTWALDMANLGPVLTAAGVTGDKPDDGDAPLDGEGPLDSNEGDEGS